MGRTESQRRGVDKIWPLTQSALLLSMAMGSVGCGWEARWLRGQNSRMTEGRAVGGGSEQSRS